MTARPDTTPPPAARRAGLGALASVAACAVIWGTTWYAITWQLGAVDPLVSIVMRFGLAAIILFGVCAAMRQDLRLTARQHLMAAGQGAFAFSISYSFTYAAEGRVPSAIVAVIFASLAFLNLVLFRLIERQKASGEAWGGAILGMAGVGVLSGGEALSGALGPAAWGGLALAAVAVTASAFGNLFAWKGQQAGSPSLPSTAWAMAYGTVLLALYGVATGVDWAVAWTPKYLASLLYLSIFGSVIAFGLYFNLARSRGYALASYISVLIQPIALLVSAVFEQARFGWPAALGLALVLAGQALLIRAPKAG